MAQAYRCDSCGDFKDGRPYRLTVTFQKPAAANVEYDTERNDFLRRKELCPECFTGSVLRIRFLADGDPEVDLPKRALSPP